VLIEFTATRPNPLWLTSITEHCTNVGKLYLCAIKDVRSNKILGYSIDFRMKASPGGVSTAQRGQAPGREQDDHPFGSRLAISFRSLLVRTIKNNGLTGSMGRVGACGDNAAMESFFSLLQKNVLNQRRWETREELRLAIITWIERTYHRRRRERGLGNLTPIEFETTEMASKAA
jgi:putative transposase